MAATALSKAAPPLFGVLLEQDAVADIGAEAERWLVAVDELLAAELPEAVVAFPRLRCQREAPKEQAEQGRGVQVEAGVVMVGPVQAVPAVPGECAVVRLDAVAVPASAAQPGAGRLQPAVKDAEGTFEAAGASRSGRAERTRQ